MEKNIYKILRSTTGETYNLPIYLESTADEMGGMVGFACLFPNTELMFIFLPVPIKAKWIVAAMCAFDLFGGLGYTGDNIAHWAHLGGAAAGFILVTYWNKTNKKTFY